MTMKLCPRSSPPPPSSPPAGLARRGREILARRNSPAYLNGAGHPARPNFHPQINDDGSISTGTLYMHRPARMRSRIRSRRRRRGSWPPATRVAIFDPKGQFRPETYPLERTPLKLILARNVNLGRANLVVGHSH